MKRLYKCRTVSKELLIVVDSELESKKLKVEKRLSDCMQLLMYAE